MWDKYIYIEAIQTLVALEYKRLIYIMIVIYGYLESESDKVFKFHLNKLSFFEISASFF